MANQYKAMKDRHQAEVDAFPMFFAFNQDQFDEGMRKLGLKPGQTKKIYKLGSTGGFYRKDDSQALKDMFLRHRKEQVDAIAADETGDGYIYDMFDYELANHEYGYTRDIEPALDALGLTVDMVNADERLLHGLNKARKEQVDWYINHN